MSNNIHDILHRLSAIEGGVRARPSKVYESEVPALLRPRVPVVEDDVTEAANGTVEDWAPSSPVYHGTNQEFSRDVVPGLWFSTYQEDAENYAEELGYGDGGIYTITLKPHKTMWLDDLNSLPNDLPKDVASVRDESWGRIIDPSIIQTMKYTNASDLTEARLEEKASEDILSKVKASFSDYLKGLEDTIKQDREILDKKKKDLDLTKKSLKDLELQAPEQVEEDDIELGVEECSAPVKTFTLECGTECGIYGDEGNGFSIRRGERELPSRFNSVDDAEMALELFNARRQAKMNSVNDTDADYLEEK